jgi:hypothetical protein
MGLLQKAIAVAPQPVNDTSGHQSQHVIDATQNDAALIIQNMARGYSARKMVALILEQGAAANLIQTLFREHKIRVATRSLLVSSSATALADRSNGNTRAEKRAAKKAYKVRDANTN